MCTDVLSSNLRIFQYNGMHKLKKKLSFVCLHAHTYECVLRMNEKPCILDNDDSIDKVLR
jgi:hypothetical protein